MSKLKCGFSMVDITPYYQGAHMDGYGFRITPAEGIRDPIYATVCAMKNGDMRYAPVSLDFCGMSRRVYDVILGQIMARDARFDSAQTGDLAYLSEEQEKNNDPAYRWGRCFF